MIILIKRISQQSSLVSQQCQISKPDTLKKYVYLLMFAIHTTVSNDH